MNHPTRTDDDSQRRMAGGFALLASVALLVWIAVNLPPPWCTYLQTCTAPVPTQVALTPSVPSVVKGLVCGSKQNLLDNSEVKRILKERYQIDKVDCQTAQSSVCRDAARLKDQDFVWPAGLYWVDVCRKTTGRSNLEYDVTLLSPIVFYSWDCVTDELVKRGQVVQTDGVYYAPNMLSFTRAIMAGTISVSECKLIRPLAVIPTDPSLSASGTEFVALLAEVLNNNEVVDEQTIEPLLVTLRKYIMSLGRLDETSAKLFANCIRKNMGACPMFAVYESQGIDFINSASPEDRQTVIDRFRIVYPQPTVWADHEIIALTPNGKRFMEAMKDKDIQAIAWAKHGFRTGGSNDPTVFPFPGIPKTIDQVIPLPGAAVIDRIAASMKP